MSNPIAGGILLEDLRPHIIWYIWPHGHSSLMYIQWFELWKRCFKGSMWPLVVEGTLCWERPIPINAYMWICSWKQCMTPKVPQLWWQTLLSLEITCEDGPLRLVPQTQNLPLAGRLVKDWGYATHLQKEDQILAAQNLRLAEDEYFPIGWIYWSYASFLIGP